MKISDLVHNKKFITFAVVASILILLVSFVDLYIGISSADSFSYKVGVIGVIFFGVCTLVNITSLVKILRSK